MDNSHLSAADWQRWLIDWVANELKLARDEIRSDENLLNYGMDSVNAIMLVGDLEDRLGAKLPPTLVWDFPTIDGLVGKLIVEASAAASAPRAPETGRLQEKIDPAKAQELLDRLDQLSDQEVEDLLEQLKQS